MKRWVDKTARADSLQHVDVEMAKMQSDIALVGKPNKRMLIITTKSSMIKCPSNMNENRDVVQNNVSSSSSIVKDLLALHTSSSHNMKIDILSMPN